MIHFDNLYGNHEPFKVGYARQRHSKSIGDQRLIKVIDQSAFGIVTYITRLIPRTYRTNRTKSVSRQLRERIQTPDNLCCSKKDHPKIIKSSLEYKTSINGY